MDFQSDYGAIFISPHFDDAVFSCGALIAQQVELTNVLVINVFSDYDGSEIHRSREEQAAAESLGFDTHALGFQDAAKRLSDDPSAARLFRPPGAVESVMVAKLAEALESFTADIRFSSIYLPLAVGWHIDHVLCHLAATRISKKAQLFFYEDAPYCFLQHAASRRLHQLGIENGSPRVAGWSQFNRIWQTVRQTALAKHLPQIARPFVELVIAKFLYQLPATQPNTPSPIALVEEFRELDSYFDSKLDGCENYPSQVAEFFVNRDAMRTFLERHSNAIAPHMGYCERYWRVKSSQ